MAAPVLPKAALGDPELLRYLRDLVKRKVPSSDVEDVVQTILCDALAAESPPTESTELRRWISGIARHKVADFHRKARREAPAEVPEQEAPPTPFEARDLAAWAEEQAKDGKEAERTLAWMAREGEGEKLEAIAAAEKVPAATVRQRVSRLRRFMRERWVAELAAVAVLALVAFAAYRALTAGQETLRATPEELPPPTGPELAPPTPLERAAELRDEARRACGDGAWRRCLQQLDEARALDAPGDDAPEIQRLRRDAQSLMDQEMQKALPVEPTATPPEVPKSAPTSAKPAPKPAPPRSTTPTPSEPKGGKFEKVPPKKPSSSKEQVTSDVLDGQAEPRFPESKK